MKFAKTVLSTLSAAVLGLLMLSLTAAPVQAATATTTMGVSATVVATCTVTANALAFGNYTNAQVDQSTTLTVTCNNQSAYNVGLDAGLSTGATVSTRKMSGPSSSLLSYSLFRDSSRTLNWGVTIGTGADTLAGTGTGAAQTITVYGRIPAGQQLASATGGYADTIGVTVTY